MLGKSLMLFLPLPLQGDVGPSGKDCVRQNWQSRRIEEWRNTVKIVQEQVGNKRRWASFGLHLPGKLYGGLEKPPGGEVHVKPAGSGHIPHGSVTWCMSLSLSEIL